MYVITEVVYIEMVVVGVCRPICFSSYCAIWEPSSERYRDAFIHASINTLKRTVFGHLPVNM